MIKLLKFSCLLMMCLLSVSIQAQETAYDSIRSFEWSYDGAYSAQVHAFGNLNVVDVATQTTVFSIEDQEVYDVAWHPTDPKILAVAIRRYTLNQPEIGVSPSIVQLIDVTTGNLVNEFDIGGTIYSVDFSPSGTQIVSGHTTLNIGPFARGFIQVIDVDTGQINDTFDMASQWIVDVKWSPAGDLIAGIGSGDNPEQLVIWDSSSGDIVGVISDPYEVEDEYGTYLRGRIRTFDWSPNGDRIVLDNNWDIDVVDTESFEIISTISPIVRFPADIVWHPSEDVIAVVEILTSLHTIHILDAISGEIIETLEYSIDYSISYTPSIRWSPDGSQLAYNAGDHIEIVPVSLDTLNP